MQNIELLIQHFSNQNLINFIRHKIPSFKPENDNFDYLFEDDNYKNYYDINKLGEADIDREDLMVLSVKTNDILTERSGKKKQYEIAKKILKQEVKDSAIFVFYDDEGNFRFSFIRANYHGRKRDFTSFKRYTYYVSPDLTNKTFIRQIEACDFSSLDAIIEAFSVKKVTKEFYDLLQSWYFKAIETATFPDDIEQSDEKRKEAVIRLITRLMFIWFMREKKLVPDKLFDKNVLDKLVVNFGNNSNYYQAVLQNLFFATLNVPMDKRRYRREKSFQGKNADFANQYVYRYHNLMHEPENLKNLFYQIPFLNGGLFECLDFREENGKRHFVDGFTETKKLGNRPYIDDTLFFNNENTGIIDIFKNYNFTVDENDPNDIEVALDPELLGNVFENLLAIFNPETADIARNATGSFYTPREVVDYMVTEALYDYFTKHIGNDKVFSEKIKKLLRGQIPDNTQIFDADTTQKLVALINSLRIVDPAVGSGAFPMTILNKLVSILEKIDPQNSLWKNEQNRVIEQITDASLRNRLLDEIQKQFERKNADFGRKLYLIQQVIYGVDIQNTAIEIAKLRFFISLLVEEKIDPDEDNLGLMPLPNLDFKLMQGNSLRETCCDIQFALELPDAHKSYGNLFDETDDRNQKIKQFKKLKEKFAVEPEPGRKKKLKKQINQILIELIIDKIENYEEALPYYLTNPNKFRKIVNEYFPILNNYFSKNNLPNANELHNIFKEIKQQVNNKLNEMLSERRPKEFFLWDIFFAEVFAEKNGFDIVIGNPPYIQLQKAIPGKSIKYADLYKDEDYQSFERTGDIYALFYELGIDHLNPNGNLCYITSNKWMRAGYGKSLRRLLSEYQPKTLIDLGPGVFDNATVDTNILLVDKKRENMHLLNALTLTDKNKLNHLQYEDFTTLTDLNENSWIILSPQEQQLKEKIERIGTPLKEWDISINYGIKTGFNEAFIINGATKDALIAQDPKSAEIIKPILRGRDIKRYKAEFADKWLINTHNGYTNTANERIQPIDINDYPAIKEHLDQYWSKLVKRQDKGVTPYNLRNCAYMDEFEKEKIVQPQTVKTQSFHLDNERYYGDVSMQFWTSKNNDIKYLLANSNSKVFNFYMRRSAYSFGETGTRWIPKFLFEVPIPKISSPQQEPFKKLVDKIIAGKEANEDTTKWEHEIDLMVYKLYNLTYKEVKIIDPAFEMDEEAYNQYRLKNE